MVMARVSLRRVTGHGWSRKWRAAKLEEKRGREDISKWRTGLYGDSEGEKERMEERNEDGENVRAVVVEHPKSRSRDQWSGYHLGPFPKERSCLFFSGRASFSVCASPPSVSKVCP